MEELSASSPTFETDQTEFRFCQPIYESAGSRGSTSNLHFADASGWFHRGRDIDADPPRRLERYMGQEAAAGLLQAFTVRAKRPLQRKTRSQASYGAINHFANRTQIAGRVSIDREELLLLSAVRMTSTHKRLFVTGGNESQRKAACCDRPRSRKVREEETTQQARTLGNRRSNSRTRQGIATPFL